MKKALYTIITILLLQTIATAQQQTPFSLYRDAPVLLNPASEFQNHFRDDYFNVRVAAIYRQQWLGVEDAPQTQVISGDYFPEYKPFSFSGNLQNRKAGAIAQTSIYGTFRYELKLDRNHKVNAGISAGMVQHRINAADIKFLEPGDVIHNGESLTTITPDFNFGLLYKFKNRYYFGLSVPQIAGLSSKFKNEANDLTINNIQHFYAQGGALFYTNKYESSFIELSAWARYIPGTPFGSNFNFRYQYDDLFWVGVGGDTELIAHLEAGLIIGRFGDRRLQLGAGYDYPFQPDLVYLGNTFEVNLSWVWGAQ
jgi:type IX secretion system PorP/SprF family membrane protein